MVIKWTQNIIGQLQYLAVAENSFINVVLTERLTKYSDDFLGLITCLYFCNFFEILKNKKSKMFCAFIDFPSIPCQIMTGY